MLVSAGRMSMGPADAAFRRCWPEARPIHLLDESLSSDGARWGATSPVILERFERIGQYCAIAQADAVLFTCSAFAEAIGRVQGGGVGSGLGYTHVIGRETAGGLWSVFLGFAGRWHTGGLRSGSPRRGPCADPVDLAALSDAQ